MVSVRGDFAPRGHSGISRDIFFDVIKWDRGECYWYLMGREKGCC